ncbi:acyltransferase [Hellea sp.]|nr:acyltransferase [Hellea sp.]
MTASAPVKTPLSGKIYNVQALRGIAAMLVVFAHLRFYESVFGGDKILSPVLKMGTSGVDLFFVISGFIMVYVTRNRADTKRFRQIPKFLFARITRIYPVYWVLTGIYVFVYFNIPGILWDSEVLPKMNFLTSFTLLPNMIHAPIVSVGWTLVFEMQFYIVFAFILLFKRKYLVPLLILWALLLAIAPSTGFQAYIVSIHSTAPIRGLAHFERLITHPYSWEFIGGALIGHYFQHIRLSKLIAACILIVGISLAVYIAFSPGKIPEDLGFFRNGSSRVLVIGAISLIILYGSLALEMAGVIFPKFLQTLGDWSYSIYLSHILVIKLITKQLWAPRTIEGPWDNIFVLIVCLISVVAVGGILFHLVERPCLSLANKAREKLFPKPQTID